MLQEYTPLPTEFAHRYRRKGERKDVTNPEQLAAPVACWPRRIVLVHREERVGAKPAEEKR